MTMHTRAMNTSARLITKVLLHTLPMAALAGVILAPSAPQPTWMSEGHSPQVIAAEYQREADAMIHEQAVKLHCTSQKPALGPVCVRNAKGFDTGVVRVVSFGDALKATSAHEVWVVGYAS